MSAITVQAGRLRNKIELQQVTKTRDAMGGETESWAKEVDVWAEIQPTTAKEQVNGDRLDQLATHIIRCRYMPSVSFTASKRFVWGSRVFNISQPPINAQERDVLIECLCIEQVNS